MGTLYMLVGLPGSGKSHWANSNKDIFNFTILSSDEYRSRYLGNVNDQSKNGHIFNMLYSDTISLLKKGKNVCLDATNINRKSRRQILSDVKKYCINTKNVCVLIMTPINIVKERNKNRDRVVPEYVIDKMLSRFEFPLDSEGFDDILIVPSGVSNYLDDCPSYKEMYKMMSGFNQENPHHSLTLDKHCKKCKRFIFTRNKDLKMAASIHDFGKLFTKSYDEKNGICHYYGHENVGAYMAYFYRYPMGITHYNVCAYINYHMQPFRIEKCKKEKAEKEISYFDKKFYRDIMKLHRADILAH